MTALDTKALRALAEAVVTAEADLGCLGEATAEQMRAFLVADDAFRGAFPSTASAARAYLALLDRLDRAERIAALATAAVTADWKGVEDPEVDKLYAELAAAVQS